LFDAETTALLRAVVEDVCESVSRYETSARIHVASMILEAASKGETSVEG
jgi:phage baseplate assembly protein W